MKKLTLCVTPVGPAFTHVDVKINEQTHRGLDFGRGGRYFVASNGVTLQSFDYPATSYNTLAVCGAFRYLDGNVVRLTTEQYNKIKAAVEEYNRVFAAPAATVAPKHIQIAGKPLPADFTKVEVTITQQTDILKSFGTADAEGHGAHEFIHGRIRLASDAQGSVGLKAFLPNRHYGKGLVGTFYMKNSNSMYATKMAIVSVEVWNLLRAAVEAYNAKYATWTAPAAAPAPKAPKAPAAPKADPCCIVVG